MNKPANIDLGRSAAAATPSSPRVVIIGAGMSGMLMGIRLLRAGHDNFTLYEKASRVGGTWRENTYPNVACDVFAPAYAYSFEPNPHWNHRFGRGEEIQKYFERTEKKYGLTSYIRFNTGIESARWDGRQWLIRTDTGIEDRAEVLVSAVGALHHPRYPDIAGLKSFAGPAFHTARWDHGVDLRGKRVGVIGTGSTAAQIVPGIVDKVDELHLFQRTAQWVLPFRDKKYSNAHKERRRRYPWLARLNHWYDLLFFGNYFSRAVVGNRLLLWHIAHRCKQNLRSIRDPQLRRKLTPDYVPACKRLVVSEDFYPAIQKDNAHLVIEGIERIVPQGIVTEGGRLIELDVLVFSTGFDVYKMSCDIIGQGGATLSDAWRDGPLVYRSVAVPRFPNFFVLFGPYSPLGNMSIIDNSEVQAGYVMQCIELIRDGVVKSLAPKQAVTEALKAELRKGNQGTVWQSGCKSWYLGANGEAIGWPFSIERFRRDLRAPVIEEFEVAG